MNAPLVLARPGAIVRPLVGTERLVALGSAKFHCNFNVTCMVELEGPVTHQALHEAALRVQQQHGALKVEVVEHPQRPNTWVFRETDALIRIEEVEARTDESWREVWDEMARTPIEGLTWRLVWVRKPGASVSQLMAGFHHSVSDIGSLTVFFDALLKALHEVHEGRPSSTQFTPLHQPLHQQVKSRLPLWALARLAWYRYFGRLRTIPFDHTEFVPPEERRWSGPFRTLEPDAVSALVENCRAHGVTLSHAISAGTILEIADRVRVREGIDNFNVALNTSLDLRRLEGANVNPRQMGLLVTVVGTYYKPRATDDVWSLAKRVKQGIDAVKARQEHRDFAMAPHLMGPRTVKWVTNSLTHGRPAEAAVLVSNFGKLDDLEHGPFRARRIFFTAAQSAFGASFLFASGTLRGRMFVHLGHPSPAISDATGAAVLNGVFERIGTSVGG